MKLTKRGYLWLAIIIIVITGLVVGGYFVYQYYQDKQEAKDASNQQTDSNSNNQNKTANWNTYINDQLAFTFKYPSGWTYEQSKLTDENWKKFRSFQIGFKPADLTIQANSTASLSVLSHAFDGYEKATSSTVSLDGVQATKEVWQTTAKGKELYKGDYKAIDYQFKHGSDSIVIYFNYKITDEADQYEQFNLLMSTFKFIAQSSATTPSPTCTAGASACKTPGAYDTWQTYTNNDVGYQLKYPQGWTIKETNETSELTGGPVKYIVVSNPADKTFLMFGLKKTGDTFTTSDRTGIGAGEDSPVTDKKTTLLGAEITPDAHIWEGKTQEYFYKLNTDSLKAACKCEASISYASTDNSSALDIPKSNLDIVNLILQSVQWL